MLGSEGLHINFVIVRRYESRLRWARRSRESVHLSEARRDFVQKLPFFFWNDGIGNCVDCIFTLRFYVARWCYAFLSAVFVACYLSVFRPGLTSSTGDRLGVLNEETVAVCVIRVVSLLDIVETGYGNLLKVENHSFPDDEGVFVSFCCCSGSVLVKRPM